MTSSIFEKIKTDVHQALKKGEKERVKILRYLISLIQREGLSSDKPLDQVAVLAVLQKEMKRKQESLEMFNKAGREDLITEQKREIKTLSGYLPEQMGKEEVGRIVEKILKAEPGLTFGEVMGKLMPQLKGRVGGEIVSLVVKEKLSER